MATIAGNALKMLNEIYNETRGNPHYMIDSSILTNKLRLSDDDGIAAIYYLIEKNLVRDPGIMGTFPMVYLNANGIDEIEGAIANPEKATANIPVPLQVVIQNMHGGVVQQGSTNSPITQYNGPQLDLPALAEQLSKLRIALWPAATEPEQQHAVVALAEAETAAKEGDQGRVIAALKKLGPAAKWVLDAVKGIATPVAAAAIKGALGIP